MNQKEDEIIAASTDEDRKALGLRDYIRKKRRTSVILGMVIGVVLIGLIWLVSSAAPARYPRAGEQIAKLRVEGIILRDLAFIEMLDEIAERDDVKAVIVEINSGGGEVYASYQIYQRLRDIGEEIPVVSVMEGTAASGGLMVALSGEQVFASPLTVTGSIGVLSELIDVEGALGRLGVGSTVVRTSDIKGGPSPLRAPSDAEIASVERTLESLNQVFKDMVAERRGLDASALAKVATGEVFVGEEAMALGLFDALGDSKTAREYIGEKYPELRDVELVEWQALPTAEEGGLPQAFVQAFGQALSKEVAEELRNQDRSYWFR